MDLEVTACHKFIRVNRKTHKKECINGNKKTSLSKERTVNLIMYKTYVTHRQLIGLINFLLRFTNQFFFK